MFKIISTGWKCDDTVDGCIESVNIQSYQDYQHIVMIDDCTGVQAQFHEPKRVYQYIHGHRGKMSNFIWGVKIAKPDDEDIICDLDLDDELFPDALSIVNNVYVRWPSLLLTYGSYQCASGGSGRYLGTYNSDDFRKQRWKASHFKTFKYKLFKRIKDRDFKGKDGMYLPACADLALMFPMMEIAGLDRIHFIEPVIYSYNDLSPHNDHKRQKGMQIKIDKYLRSKKPYERVETW